MTQGRILRLLDMVDQSPNDPFLLFALAQEYGKIQEIEKALQYYEMLTKQHPQYVGTYYHYGNLLHKNGQSENALSIIQTGINITNEAKDTHALNELRGLLAEIQDAIE